MYIIIKNLLKNYIYSDAPSIDNGSTYAHIFFGKKSLVSDVYVMKTDNHLVNTLEDNVRAWGSTSKLIIDRDKSEFINCEQSILQSLFMDY